MFGTFSSDNAEAQLETLVMPGEVIAGHADIETKCKSCHVAFERDKQSELCMDCHEDVAADRTSERGFHGLDRNAKRRECAFCHADHEGRDADIVPLDESSFTHKATDFQLDGKHTGVPCADCHQAGDKHRDAPSMCIACHKDDNVHGETMGDACADCHSPVGWTEVTFDHDTTGFGLIGK
ncbi:MAG: cytochrome c3 family protein, partial [Woeseiaceae bacterium]